MIAIDHVVLPVEDLGAAAGTLTDAGFVVTPEAPHPFGTSNRLLVFEDIYVELISVTDDGRVPESGFARQVADHLATGHTGFSHLALSTDSVPNAVEVLAKHGLEAGEPMWFNRPAPRSDGSTLIASFDIIPIVGIDRAFFCVHHTPSNVWFRPHLEHPNGVTSVTEVHMENAPDLSISRLSRDRNGIALDVSIGPIEMSGVTIG